MGGNASVSRSQRLMCAQDFHGKYYHPSNARFWFYGDDPADERLRLLSKYLDEFEARPVDSTVHAQPLRQVLHTMLFSHTHIDWPQGLSCCNGASLFCDKRKCRALLEEASRSVLVLVCRTVCVATLSLFAVVLCRTPSTRNDPATPARVVLQRCSAAHLLLIACRSCNRWWSTTLLGKGRGRKPTRWAVPPTHSFHLFVYQQNW